MTFKDLKPGTKVVIVDRRVSNMNYRGLMDKWLGETVTVKQITGKNLNGSFSIEEDQRDRGGGRYGWAWHKHMVDWEKTNELQLESGGEY